MPRQERLFPRVVRARNDGSVPFSAKYDGERYVIMPNSESLIPWEAMCLWFGHPEAMDLDKKRRVRSDELNRLYVKYGVYEKHHLRDQHFPKVSIWDITTQKRILTVVDDPEGKHLDLDVTATQNVSLQEQLRQMQQQMAVMQELINQQGNGNTNPLSAAELVDHVATEAEDRPELRPNGVVEEVDDGAEVDTPSRVKAPVKVN